MVVYICDKCRKKVKSENLKDVPMVLPSTLEIRGGVGHSVLAHFDGPPDLNYKVQLCEDCLEKLCKYNEQWFREIN